MAQWYVKSIEDKIVALLTAGAGGATIRRVFDTSTDMGGAQIVVDCRDGGNFEGNDNIFVVDGKIVVEYQPPDDEAGATNDTLTYTIFNIVRQWSASSFSGLDNVTVDGLVLGEILREDDGNQVRNIYNMTFYCTVS